MNLEHVAIHDLLVAAVIGSIFGVLGYYLTRVISPYVEAAV